MSTNDRRWIRSKLTPSFRLVVVCSPASARLGLYMILGDFRCFRCIEERGNDPHWLEIKGNGRMTVRTFPMCTCTAPAGIKRVRTASPDGMNGLYRCNTSMFLGRSWQAEFWTMKDLVCKFVKAHHFLIPTRTWVIDVYSWGHQLGRSNMLGRRGVSPNFMCVLGVGWGWGRGGGRGGGGWGGGGVGWVGWVGWGGVADNVMSPAFFWSSILGCSSWCCELVTRCWLLMLRFATSLGTCNTLLMLRFATSLGTCNTLLMLRFATSLETCNTLLMLRFATSLGTYNTLLMLRFATSLGTCNTLLMLRFATSLGTCNTLLMLRFATSLETCNTLLMLRFATSLGTYNTLLMLHFATSLGTCNTLLMLHFATSLGTCTTLLMLRFATSLGTCTTLYHALDATPNT